MKGFAPERENSSRLRALYPFLASTTVDLNAVLAQVRHSTADKLLEIVTLRDQVGHTMAYQLSSCAEAMASALLAQGKLLTFGNGGSATDAHAVAHLFLHPPAGRPLPALALANESAVVTALANDIGFEMVFARQIAAFGDAGDIALGISTSGNSENVIRAFDEAARRGLLTVGIAGYDGGKMAELSSLEYLFVIPSSSVHRIQEAQTTVYNVLWELTQEALRIASPEEQGEVHNGHTR